MKCQCLVIMLESKSIEAKLKLYQKLLNLFSKIQLFYKKKEQTDLVLYQVNPNATHFTFFNKVHYYITRQNILTQNHVH